MFRLTVSVADIVVEVEDDSANPTIESLETLMARTMGTVLNAYAGLVDIDALATVGDDEEDEEE